MPSLKEIKNRLTSVNSTRKITSAMKMVASSKLHHAQQMIENMLPYETMLEHILKTFLASEADASTVFNVERPVKRVALVVYASNSSLCGDLMPMSSVCSSILLTSILRSWARTTLLFTRLDERLLRRRLKWGFMWQATLQVLPKSRT